MMAQNKTLLDILEDYSEFIVDLERGSNVDVIPTGSISLDTSIGIGGIPIGRFTEIFGAESSGKTSLCLCITKNAIKKGLNVLYVDQEQGLDAPYITSLVGDYDKTNFMLMQPDTAEQALEICEKGINSGKFGLIILDSIGSLAPEVEKKKELVDKNVALVSSIITHFLRRNAYAINKNNTAFIFINQVRDTIGSYVKSYSTPGGHALKHFSSLRIFLSKGLDIEVDKEKIGMYCRFTIKKNKLGVPFKSFGFPFVYKKGVDSTRDILEFSEMLGVLEKRGSYYTFEGENIGQGVVKTKVYLESNPEVLDKIVGLVYNIAAKPELASIRIDDGDIVEVDELAGADETE
jgi:recombination protein RecA